MKLPDKYENALKSHFDSIIGMLREGTVPHYEFSLITEANRFEAYMIENKIVFTKSVTYSHHKVYMFFSLGVDI